MSGSSQQPSDPSSAAPVVQRLEDGLYSRHAPRLIWGAAACGTMGYLWGVLPEAVEGLLLAGAIVLHASGWLLRELVAASRGFGNRLVAVAAAAGVLTVSMGPALATLAPGEPLVTGSVSQPGEVVWLTSDAGGASRLLVHGALAGATGEAHVRFTFQAGDQQLRGELARTMVRTRVGRRGRASVPHGHDTVFLEGKLPPSARAIRLTRLDGPLRGPLELRIFRQRLGFWHWALLALGVAVSVSVLQIRRRYDLRATFAACGALVFGLLVYRFTTPADVLGGELGALLVAGVVAALATLLVAKLGGALRPQRG